jgi:tetratricopeptide (TPR) repeat protein
VRGARGACLAAGLALLAPSCGPRAGEKPPPLRPRTGPIDAPDGALLPVARPPGVGLDARALQRIRRRELYLQGLIGAGGSDLLALATAYGELGKVYHAFGLPESAIPCYGNAWRLQPSSFEWPYLMAEALWSTKKGPEAAAAVGQALALQPNDVPALVLLGDIQRALGRAEPAREAYTRAVAVSSRCAPALYGLGELAALEGNDQRAVEMFEATLKVQPMASRVHYPLALAYGRLGNTAEARRHLVLRGEAEPAMANPLYDAVLSLNPVTYARRGQVALQAGDLVLALQMLRPAAEALPEDAGIRMHLGAALALSGDLEGAVAQYRAAVKLQPTNPHAHYNLGLALISLGKDEEALAPLRRAIELHPEFRQALFSLGQALIRLGRHAEALSPLEQTLKLSPTYEPARLAQARALARLGRCRDARASLEQGVGLARESRPMRGLLAQLLAACASDTTADPARALQLAEQVFAEEGTAENAASVAFVHASRASWNEAVRWQRRAVELLHEDLPPGTLAGLEARLRDYEAHRFSVEW